MLQLLNAHPEETQQRIHERAGTALPSSFAPRFSGGQGSRASEHSRHSQFAPSYEWAAIAPGQSIPPGIETRLSLSGNGARWARIPPRWRLHVVQTPGDDACRVDVSRSMRLADLRRALAEAFRLGGDIQCIEAVRADGVLIAGNSKGIESWAQTVEGAQLFGRRISCSTGLMKLDVGLQHPISYADAATASAARPSKDFHPKLGRPPHGDHGTTQQQRLMPQMTLDSDQDRKRKRRCTETTTLCLVAAAVPNHQQNVASVPPQRSVPDLAGKIRSPTRGRSTTVNADANMVRRRRSSFYSRKVKELTERHTNVVTDGRIASTSVPPVSSDRPNLASSKTNALARHRRCSFLPRKAAELLQARLIQQVKHGLLATTAIDQAPGVLDGNHVVAKRMRMSSKTAVKGSPAGRKAMLLSLPTPGRNHGSAS